ncbi:MAG: response regulator [Candidatus Levybacteria bacterium]|nr:response regulator [Candidatus Levybacteria bacterium]
MRKILIAEDDFFIRDIYSKVFALSGYEVAVAVDGMDALEKIKAQTYDMVLLDIMMPRMTGIDVLKNIRSAEEPIKSIPIFIITNLGQQNVIEEAFRLGMDGYILKSQVTPQQIVDEINNFFLTKEALPQT